MITSEFVTIEWGSREGPGDSGVKIYETTVLDKEKKIDMKACNDVLLER